MKFFIVFIFFLPPVAISKTDVTESGKYIEQFKKAADQGGDGHSKYMLASELLLSLFNDTALKKLDYYRSPHRPPVNENQILDILKVPNTNEALNFALRTLQEAAELGHLDSKYILMRIYDIKSENAEFEWSSLQRQLDIHTPYGNTKEGYERAAFELNKEIAELIEQGGLNAYRMDTYRIESGIILFTLAQRYKEGRGSQQDPAKAQHWLEKTVEQHPMYKLAEDMLNGRGGFAKTSENVDRAIILLEEIINRGLDRFNKAQNKLKHARQLASHLACTQAVSSSENQPSESKSSSESI